MSEPRDTVHGYIDSVLSGEIAACTWVKKAAARHLQDLETCQERGLWFDEQAAQIVIDFFGLLKHSKGEWAGQTVKLEPWQQFVLWVMFGWIREDGSRRYRTAYLEVARKNGKSTLAAGVGLYLLVADGEPGAEVYSAATMRDQARITHSEATRMVKASPALRKRITVFKDNLHIANTASKYEPLSSDYNSLQGLNVHGVVVDEVHAHRNRDLWDVLETATGARRQPLMFAITTAGFDRQSLCFQLHEYAEKVLDGVIQDDSFFGIIYTLDEGDEWENEALWVKSNPASFKKVDDMRRLAERAREMPAALNSFLRLHLDLWTQSETRWLPIGHWQECGQAVDANGLRGRTCYAGLDLSSNTDITALALVFPPETDADQYQVLWRFWLPEDNMHDRVHRDRVPYDVWVRQGYLSTTPGNVIDHAWILAEIDELAQAYDIREVAFDRWGAAQIQTKLMELGGENWMVQFGQGFVSMSPPMKELEKLILGHKLAHGNNPVATWMAHNVMASQDPAGNIKPDKGKSMEKIDGVVALIMALDRATRHEPPRRSIYEQRGLEVA